MKATRTILAIAAMAVAAGCAKQTGSTDNGGATALRVNSVTPRQTVSKAVIEGASFSSGDAIGIFLTDSDGGTVNYNSSNCKYTYDGSVWTAATDIMLSEAKGKLYGYFPYSASVTDLAAIPVESSLNGTDYMYAEPVDNVCKSDPAVSLTMHHALALVSVKLVKNAAYTGSAALTALSLEGTGIAAGGNLNLTDGAISGATAAAVSSGTISGTITESGITEKFLIVPIGEVTDAQDVTLKCTIDGRDYTASFAASSGNGLVVRSNYHSTATVTIKPGKLEATSVSIVPWTDGSSAEADLQ